MVKFSKNKLRFKRNKKYSKKRKNKMRTKRQKGEENLININIQKNGL